MTGFNVGRFACAVIETGPLGPYGASNFCANATPQEAVDLVGADQVMSGLNCLLVQDGEHVILIDTGMGMLAPGFSERLREQLAVNAVAPDDVTLVLTSHGHPDHIGGHITDGKPTFARASYLFSQVEWDYFRHGTGVEMFDNAAQAILPPLEAAGVVEWMGLGEIVPGIEAVEAPGHTPGHVAFAITDEGKRALYLADSFFFPRHVERPDLYSSFDWDGPLSAESRKRLVGRAADEGATVVVYHLEGPGIGRIERADAAYRWIASPKIGSSDGPQLPG